VEDGRGRQQLHLSYNSRDTNAKKVGLQSQLPNQTFEISKHTLPCQAVKFSQQ